MFHLPPSEGHCQFHPNSINEFSKCFIVSLFQTVIIPGFLPNFTSRRCAITLIPIIQIVFRLEMLINLLVLSLSPFPAAPGPH